MTTNNRATSIAALLLASAAVWFFPSRAEATIERAASFDEKVENAAAIVVGKVVKQETKFDPSRRWILTYTTFNVEKSLKGGTGGEITVVTPGGHVGDIYQDTIGVPEFKKGDDHVVFVKNSSAGPTVLYFDQGTYDVIKDDKGERIVAPVASDAVQLDTQRGMAVTAETPRTLRDFETAVRTSERRTTFNRMEMIKKQQRTRQVSLFDTIVRYKYLLAAAVIGFALMSVHLLRK
jgi:hypothetical protein